MSIEGQNPSEYKPFATISAIGGLILLYEIANLGFSGKTRDKIVGRSGNRSEISGVEPPEGESLQIMHKDHTKDETYDHPSRGLAVTLAEHIIYHVVHRGRANEIGLDEISNENAIRLLSSKKKR